MAGSDRALDVDEVLLLHAEFQSLRAVETVASTAADIEDASSPLDRAVGAAIARRNRLDVNHHLPALEDTQLCLDLSENTVCSSYTASGGSKYFEKGGRKTIYQPRPY